MKKIIAVVLVFFLCLNVYAIDACTDSEMSKLKELANNIQFKSDYEIKDVDEDAKDIIVLYDINIINFDPSLRIRYTSKYDPDEYIIKSDTTKISNITDGDTVTFKIYSYTTNLCTDELLKTVTVKVPALNTYYYFNKEKCSNYPDFKYCKEFMDIDEDFEEIDKKFEEYLNPSKSSTDDNKKNEKNITLYIIIGGVVVIGIGIVTTAIILSKKKKKDDL